MKLSLSLSPSLPPSLSLTHTYTHSHSLPPSSLALGQTTPYYLEAAAAGRGVTLAEVSDRARDGMTGARRTGDIGFSAIRGGDIIGEHDVMFAAAGERIILRHVASDRSVFARGALKAALWGLRQSPGQYDMLDVLGLSD